jgi:phosphoserine phosphatase
MNSFETQPISNEQMELVRIGVSLIRENLELQRASYTISQEIERITRQRLTLLRQIQQPDLAEAHRQQMRVQAETLLARLNALIDEARRLHLRQASLGLRSATLAEQLRPLAHLPIPGTGPTGSLPTS